MTCNLFEVYQLINLKKQIKNKLKIKEDKIIEEYFSNGNTLNNRYKILTKLDNTSDFIVIKAFDTHLNMNVAIKVMC